MKRRLFGLEEEIPDKQCPLTLKEDYKHAVLSKSDLLLFAGTRKRRTFSLREMLSVGINLTSFSRVPDIFGLEFEAQGNANAFLLSSNCSEFRELNLTNAALRAPHKLHRRLRLRI